MFETNFSPRIDFFWFSAFFGPETRLDFQNEAWSALNIVKEALKGGLLIESFSRRNSRSPLVQKSTL